MIPSRFACPACAEEWGSNGKCAACDGTGVNPHLNSAEPKCEACRGTGVCESCGGTGRIFPGAAESGFIKLFE